MRDVFVVGSVNEPTTAHTLARAQDLGVHLRFFDLREFLSFGRVDFETNTVIIGTERFTLTRGAAVYQRLIYDSVYIGNTSPAKRMRFGLLLELLRRCHDSGHARIFNVPGRQDPNSSKIAQTIDLRNHGFAVPRSLATNDPRAARKFVSSMRSIYKSLSGERSIVTVAPPETSERYNMISYIPTLFQEYIAGDDVRVHTVGKKMIAERVRSTGVDYRYTTGNQHSSICVPSTISTLLTRYSDATRIWFLGADFKVNESGEWIALEINTMPGYSGYDQRAGGSISTALLEAMVGDI